MTCNMFQFNNVINNHYSFSQKLSDEIQLTLKVQCKEVKTQQVDRNNVVNLTTCFGLLGGHHQVQQAHHRSYEPYSFFPLYLAIQNR